MIDLTSWMIGGPKWHLHFPISFFIDIKSAHSEDILNIYQVLWCYNILLWVMFYFDLYLR